MKKIVGLFVMICLLSGTFFVSCKKDLVLPVLTTNAVTSITINSGVSGGAITSNGGADITARGVCWSTSRTPTISGSHSSDGTGTSSFVSNITGLTPNTTYYVRAYATNSVGTAYGDEVSFTTTPIVVATLSTTAVTAITITTAVSGGDITVDGGGAVTARGVCWGTTAAPTISNDKTSDGTGSGVFTSNLTGLLPATTYYVRAYATNSAGTAYGNEITFTTSPIVVPTLTTVDVTSITLITAVSGGNITADGGGAVMAKGVCWAVTANPTISNSKTSDGTGTGIFASSLTGLLPGTLYHVRAYATNSAGTAYGNDVSFTTSPIVAATITTTAVSAVTLTTASSGGNITSDGGGTITARGACWAITTNPTINNFKSTDGTGTGSFISSLTNLTPGTTYYVRAYATNSWGTSYGSEISFTTNPVVVATLTTTAVTSVTLTTAVSGGNITANGGGNVTARGVCWSTSLNPTVGALNTTTDGTGNGIFTSNLSSLLPGTVYHVRAYATNSAGTGYGNDISFTTTPIVIPTLTTSAVSSITLTTAVSGGNVTANGGGTVSARGVCWSTSASPTIGALNTTIDGSGTGAFTSNITGLLPGTLYHVRAYATNSAGTAYGSDVSFTTTAVVLATLTTTSITSVTLTTAVSGGNITNDGGGTITARGACWATTANPTISNSTSSNGTGTGTFASTLSGLDQGTTYYVRAYATNGAGTAYGNQFTFNTKVADIDLNTYNTVTIGTQVWMAENLKTTKLNNNTTVTNVTDNTAWTLLSTAGLSWYDNDAVTYKPTYGALYNWFAVHTGNLCPTGWHVPTDLEFNTMELSIGVPLADINLWDWRGTTQGAQLKNTTGWATGENGTNTTGFSALPGGYRYFVDGVFTAEGITSYWWTSTELDAARAWYRQLDGTHTSIFKGAVEKQAGKYVRCIKD
jgi:uncharacterized protein (TIGR02145 family)